MSAATLLPTSPRLLRFLIQKLLCGLKLPELLTLPLTAMVRQFGNCAGATNTVVLSAAATVSNIAVAVDKI